MVIFKDQLIHLMYLKFYNQNLTNYGPLKILSYKPCCLVEIPRQILGLKLSTTSYWFCVLTALLVSQRLAFYISANFFFLSHTHSLSLSLFILWLIMMSNKLIICIVGYVVFLDVWYHCVSVQHDCVSVQPWWFAADCSTYFIQIMLMVDRW